MRFNDCLLDCERLKCCSIERSMICSANSTLFCIVHLKCAAPCTNNINNQHFFAIPRKHQKLYTVYRLCHCNLHAFRVHLCHCCTRRRCSSAACNAGISALRDPRRSFDTSNNVNVSCLGGDFVVGLFYHP